MKLRDELLTKLVQTARESVAGVVVTPAYPDLVKRLIVQGLIKIEEPDVTVLCREADVAVCEKVVPAAVAEYADIIKRETGEVVVPKVKINTDPKKVLPEHKCSGGVCLTACNGRIVCDNTLDARIGLVYNELLPTIRTQLWDAHKDKK